MKSLWSLVMGVALLSVVFTACSEDEGKVTKSFSDYDLNGIVIKDGVYTDARNGHEYRIMRIWRPPYSDSYNLWFAENLDYVDSTLEDNSWCYKDSKDSCKVYGRLYSWEAAQKACPDGWHLPNQQDWADLKDVVGTRIEPAGTKLKTVDHWLNADSVLQGTNRFGFYGLPAGRKNVEGGWLPTGKFAYFWTSSVSGINSPETSLGWQLTYETDELGYGDYYRGHGMSVRCVASYSTYSSNDVHIEGDLDSSYVDEIPVHFGKLEYKGKTYKTIELFGRTYMAENMNFETGNSWCYNNSADSCKKYGRLYDKETAVTVCPEGWSLMNIGVDGNAQGQIFSTPSSLRTIGDFYAEEIKSTDSWVQESGNNLSGMNLLPSGGYDIGSEAFFDVGYTAYLWTINSWDDANYADTVSVALRYYDFTFSLASNGKNYAYAVRCEKDLPRN